MKSQDLILHEFAERIRDAHAAVLACDEHMAEQKRRKIQKAIACGEHLIEAKKIMDHGQWRSWVADNCKGIISKPERAEPSEYVKAKGLAVQLWNLLHRTADPERMAKEIEAVLLWHHDYMEQKRKREAALEDGFDDAPLCGEPTTEVVA